MRKSRVIKKSVLIMVSFGLIFTFVNTENFNQAQTLYAYVANSGSDSISVINLSTNTVTTTISLPPGSFPQEIVATPDGRKLYVTNIGNGTVSVINTATNTIKRTIILPGGAGPQCIAITPDGLRAFVVDNFNNNIIVIDTLTDAVIGSIAPPPLATFYDITISPDGLTAYITDNGSSGNVFVIDTSTYALINIVPTPGACGAGITFTPDGSKVYMADPCTLSGFAIDTMPPFVVVAVAWPILPPVVGPWDVAVHPGGTYAYFTDSFFVGGSTVLVVDTTTDTQIGFIPVGIDPTEVIFSPSGSRAYVTHSSASGSVSVIDTATSTVIASIPVGSNPYGIALAYPQIPRPRPTVNPIPAFRVIANHHLRQVNTCLGGIEEYLPEDVPQDVQTLLDEMQEHINNANTTGNTIYANNELLKALKCCEDIQEKLDITCAL